MASTEKLTTTRLRQLPTTPETVSINITSESDHLDLLSGSGVVNFEVFNGTEATQSVTLSVEKLGDDASKVTATIDDPGPHSIDPGQTIDTFLQVVVDTQANGFIGIKVKADS